ncbi:MAG: methyltransferase domain-containing protein [Gammaproteobacteria bacterium]|jgi:arsenite methyltransferase|nr:methyltransferase domain-containing protein [Gammaproteobacteria bacterium]MBT5221627.1 methyltransferase domain-containing protein [Gammaproteobacteria bacterium]MBT5826062.1 methyltransferase domain-containing protein [Gammaproteobacteria bacterium]MBT6419862.1 methyltransferase domain-containing protein [Gammaproteobacteria bacterium]MBT6577218.1 methyltransferase domain-containing protein [Gammaproteobacteria bacterium]
MTDTSISDSVQNYYGQVLKSSQDLKTSACCTLDSIPQHLRPLLSDLHPEVVERYYGCGTPLPPALDGATVLDLGCGTGRDCYLLSRLVGESGRVIGIDMTTEQLAIAKEHCDWHAQRYGYASSNVEFKQGYMEDLATAGIADNSIDLVVSNCVINLSPDKKQVLAEILRVLKPGGEIYFSDVYADRRIPQALKIEPVLLGECLGGALYWEDFRRIMQELGCPDVRVVKESLIALEDPEVDAKIGMVNFRSVTIRAFKISLEDRCEDFGQLAIYKGTITEYPHAFDLDDHHHFETGKPLRVCGNTFEMLTLGRYAMHFELIGNKSQHFGLFNCAPPNTSISLESEAACC